MPLYESTSTSGGLVLTTASSGSLTYKDLGAPTVVYTPMTWPPDNVFWPSEYLPDAEEQAFLAECDRALHTPEPAQGWDEDCGGPKLVLIAKQVNPDTIPAIRQIEGTPTGYQAVFEDGFIAPISMNFIHHIQALSSKASKEALTQYLIQAWLEAHPGQAETEEVYGLPQAV
jgi:hypothetical protein